MKYIALLTLITFSSFCYAQDYGDYPTIEKELLLRDLELLRQALDKYHTGMYWYTPKDSVEAAFQRASEAITEDLNVLAFHKIIAPLVALSREDHTNIFLPAIVKETVRQRAQLFPLRVTFLGKECYVIQNGSNDNAIAAGMKITKINGETIENIVGKIGNLFSSDGYVQRVKYSDLRGLQFAVFYYYYYGNQSRFTLELEGQTVEIDALGLQEISANIVSRYEGESGSSLEKENLEFTIINDSTAYIAFHTFDTGDIGENATNKKLSPFLESSFATISDRGIKYLIVDLSENTGGNEGNENLVYSYLGENYQKYISVRAKAQKVILDNGVDKPIKLTTFGFFERVFANRKMEDGSYERKENVGFGLMAYKKEPLYKFEGELYVLISPVTYSGGSELANMIYTNDLATFVGEETGGGYYGNTSGYGEELTLPHSKITVDVPSLKFEMNVNDTLPFGRGVIPHHEVIATFDEYVNKENAALNFVLDLIRDKE